MNLKKHGKVFTSKFVGTGPSSYEKRIYWATVSQRLRNTGLCHDNLKRCVYIKVVARFVLVTALLLNIQALWDIVPCC